MILDIRMPDIDGQEVCRIIKADEGAAYLPIVLVTAYEERGLRLRALDCNADELLLAPVNRLELLARVRSLLRLKIYYQDLVRHESVVLSLSAALEAKDPYTRGHSQRVGELSTRLARELGQDAVVVQRMRTAGLLHDIGKVAIPQSLLNKPGRLTTEEFAKLMTHPVVGWEICKPLRTAQSVLDCILYHHERFDGCGYPHGLAGEKIPYQARLLAVADALDALTSERAYRRSLSVAEAVELLGHETDAGKWDPEIFVRPHPPRRPRPGRPPPLGALKLLPAREMGDSFLISAGPPGWTATPAARKSGNCHPFPVPDSPARLGVGGEGEGD